MYQNESVYSIFYNETNNAYFRASQETLVYLAIVGAPFISLIYGVASRIVDIFAPGSQRL